MAHLAVIHVEAYCDLLSFNHKYLGIGLVKISMFEYVEEILATFDTADTTAGDTKSTSAPEDLFTINDDSEKIGQAKTVEFYNRVAKSLFAIKRAIPDTCTSVAFFSTSVEEMVILL
jgi:hypothetical protein